MTIHFGKLSSKDFTIKLYFPVRIDRGIFLIKTKAIVKQRILPAPEEQYPTINPQQFIVPLDSQGRIKHDNYIDTYQDGHYQGTLSAQSPFRLPYKTSQNSGLEHIHTQHSMPCGSFEFKAKSSYTRKAKNPFLLSQELGSKKMRKDDDSLEQKKKQPSRRVSISQKETSTASQEIAKNELHERESKVMISSLQSFGLPELGTTREPNDEAEPSPKRKSVSGGKAKAQNEAQRGDRLLTAFNRRGLNSLEQSSGMISYRV